MQHRVLEETVQEKSFLTRIQGWFSAGNHGRYLGITLAEIGRKHPRALATLVTAGCGLPRTAIRSLRAEPEWVFRARTGYRRADLAIFDDAAADPSVPVVLIEIKYNDKPIPSDGIKPAQLDDYLDWQDAVEGRGVLVLSRETISHPPLVTMRWTQAAHVLQPFTERSEFVSALVDHLKDEGLVMQNIESKALIGFLKRLLCSRNGSGMLAGNIEGPDQFGRLLSNVKLLSARFNPDFRDCWRSAGGGVDSPGTKVASIDFEIANELKTRDERKVFEDDGSFWVDSKVKSGGYVEVFAKHAIGSGKSRLRILYGICFNVDAKTSEKNPPRATLFVVAFGEQLPKEGLRANASVVAFSRVTDDAAVQSDKLEAYLIPKLHNVFRQLLKDHQLTSVQRKALLRLLVRMEQRQPDLAEVA